MPKRKTYNKNATSLLKEWMLSKEHLFRPYPSILERRELSMKTGLDDKQILNWFVNARKRIWQPLLTAMGENVDRFILPTGNNGKDRSLGHDSDDDPKGVSTQVVDQTSFVFAETPLQDIPDWSTFPLRRGQWTREEEDYVSAIIDAFIRGMLPIQDKITLRNYLAMQLHCSPMRISKKFVGNAKLGKTLYCSSTENDAIEVETVLENLRYLGDQFHAAVCREYALELISSRQETNHEKGNNHKRDLSSLQKEIVPLTTSAMDARKALSELLGLDESTCDLSDHPNFLLNCPLEDDFYSSMDSTEEYPYSEDLVRFPEPVSSLDINSSYESSLEDLFMF